VSSVNSINWSVSSRRQISKTAGRCQLGFVFSRQFTDLWCQPVWRSKLSGDIERRIQASVIRALVENLEDAIPACLGVISPEPRFHLREKYKRAPRSLRKADRISIANRSIYYQLFMARRMRKLIKDGQRARLNTKTSGSFEGGG
jgi:hypothetical protein